MNASRVLIVDDSDEFRSSVRDSLGRVYALDEAVSESDFRQLYRPYTYDLVILDMRLDSGREGLRLLRDIRSVDEMQPVIMVSAYGDTDAVIDSAEAGALMFLHKQEFTPELLARMVEAVLEQARTQRQLAALRVQEPAISGAFLLGGNDAVRRARELIRYASDSASSVVLVSGETGAGHYQAARAIHAQSRVRAKGPFVVASGFSFSDENGERMLFGGGSSNFSRHRGLLEQAMQGLFLLENSAATPDSVLRALWKALRARRFRAGDHEIPFDVQLVLGIPPDHADPLADELTALGVGEVVRIELPALRQRVGDIALLANARLQELREQGRTSAKTFSPEALRLLEQWPWPGNLMELFNTVEFVAIQAMLENCERIAKEHLPDRVRGGAIEHDVDDGNYQVAIARAEIGLVERALLKQNHVNNSQLASILGYTDRFAIARRIRKAFSVSRALEEDFPLSAQRFLSRTRVV